MSSSSAREIKIPQKDLAKIAQLQKISTEIVGTIFAAQAKLNMIVRHFNARLYKRWKKRSRQKRTDLLSKAWPGINKIGRPDWFAVSKLITLAKSKKLDYDETAIFWPGINLEDLGDKGPENFLLFLISRAWHSPEKFALSDLCEVQLGYYAVTKDMGNSACSQDFIPHHWMLVTNDNGEYGKMVSVVEDPEAASSGRGVDTREGLLLLKIQQRMLVFLIDCCKEIMHEINLDEFLVSSSVLLSDSLNLQTDWLELYKNAESGIYGVPNKINLEDMLDTISAKRGEAEDNLWLLRESPNHFYDELGDYMQNSDHSQARNPSMSSVSPSKVDEKIVSSFIQKEYQKFTHWGVVEESFMDLCTVHEDLGPEADISAEVSMKVLLFRELLLLCADLHKKDLRETLPNSPPLRTLFKCNSQGELEYQHSFGSDNLMDVLLGIAGWQTNSRPWGEISKKHCTDQQYIEALDGLLERDKSQSRLSRRVTRIIDDIGCISAMMTKLTYYKPYARPEHYLRVLPSDSEEKKMQEYTSRDIMHLLSKVPSIGLSKFVNPLGRFACDKDKCTESSTKKVQEAERDLDALWGYVDEVNRKLCDGVSLFEMVDTWFECKRSLDMIYRTPPWIGKTRPPQVSSTIDDVDEATSVFEHLTVTETGSSPIAVPGPPSKVKTRSQAVSTPTELDIEPVQPLAAPKIPKFHLKLKIFKVFKALFFMPSVGQQQGTVAWVDFLTAMGEMGFEIKKLRGSMRKFKPTNRTPIVLPETQANGRQGTGRHIIFHDPHPSSKVQFEIVRTIGRRLTKAYGWTGEMFELE